MSNELKNKKIAILANDGFEQSELTEPLSALQNAGADVRVVSPKGGEIKGWQHDHWGDPVDVDLALTDTDAKDFDGLLVPGGLMNPDSLRRNNDALQFVRRFFEAGKPVAAICHGPWVLIDAGVVDGRRMTSYSTIQSDLRNAGADWVDEEVVVDSGLVTSRSPADLPAFIDKMIEEFGEGVHAGQATASAVAG
ncbi:MAG: type 1 glutamine amidotransferase domain-containing protein [Acidobacteriota bacterium]